MNVPSRPNVVVLGAGVIGLTTAITLAEAKNRVLVRTADPPGGTTSSAAGALWGPWLTEPAGKVTRWAEHTLDVLTRMCSERGTAVRLASGRDVSTVLHDPPPWFRLLHDRRLCEAGELPVGYSYGHCYSAPLVDMPAHLAYLVDRLQAAGGTIDVSPVKSIAEAETVAPVVINCTGIGARELVHDTEIYPIRGQHVVVANPGITDFLEVDTGDSTDLIAIYPHGDDVVLGGTAEPHNWTHEADRTTTREIVRRCAAVEPRLANARVLDVRVGLRPTRSEVRLEAEQTTEGLLIHNYGHGGAGVSLSWGCAAGVAEIVASYTGPGQLSASSLRRPA